MNCVGVDWLAGLALPRLLPLPLLLVLHCLRLLLPPLLAPLLLLLLLLLLLKVRLLLLPLPYMPLLLQPLVLRLHRWQPLRKHRLIRHLHARQAQLQRPAGGSCQPGALERLHVDGKLPGSCCCQ